MNPTWIYVAVVYAIAVYLTRRGRIDLPWRVAGLFYVLVLFFMWKAMTGPYVNFPADFVKALPPWSFMHRHVVRVGNGELNDLPMQIVPWAIQVRDAWQSFHIPLWNALSGAGYPLLANGQSSALSFLRIITLPLSLGHALTAEAAFKLLIAMSFTFLYCRRRAWSELACATGAVSFGFCSFLAVWLHFPLVTVACFVPAMLYAIDLLAEGITYGRFVFGALLWTAIIFGGHPETASHIFFLALLYVVWLMICGEIAKPVRFILGLGAVMVVAAALASPFLAPVAEAITKSKRYQFLQAWQKPEGNESGVPFVISLFEPHFFGDVPVEAPWGPAHAETITAFAGLLGVAGWLALLIDGIARRRFRSREFFFVLLTPVLFGIVLDWPVIGTIFHRAFALAANGRMRLLIAFVFAIQAAALVDLIEQGRRLPAAIGLAFVTAGLAWLLQPMHFDTAWHKPSAFAAVIPSIITVVIAALAVLMPLRARPFALMVLLVAVTNEVWCTGIDWNQPVHERYVYPKTPVIAKMQELRDASRNDPFRIVGIGTPLFPNTNAAFGLADVRVHDPMASGRYIGFLRNVTKDYNPGDYFAQWKDADTTLLNFLGVRYVLTLPRSQMTAPFDPSRFKVAYDGKDAMLFENVQWRPRFFPIVAIYLDFKGDAFIHHLLNINDWSTEAVLRRLPVENDQERRDLLAPRAKNAPMAKVQIVSATDTDYKLRIDAPRYTLITSSIPFWPGWKVTENGRKLEPLQVDHTFFGFVVRPGMSEVRVRYVPATFWVSAWLSLLTLATIVALSRESLRLRLRTRLRME
ncbi:MAG TPA: YfhO family protein [Thermoanaerobaculia bacterium]